MFTERSGKTQVAIMRIAAELERCEPDKLVWMLCPTVHLAQQQCMVVQNQLPAYQCRTLSSLDDVDHWSNATVWFKALENFHVVVSTPAVLYDAMTHGFVAIQKIALLVFDEAHHCQKKHATNKIMQEFYHPQLSKGGPVPHILGLTASPADSAVKMEVVERNLNSVCRTPKAQVEDLRQYVHRPILEKLSYDVDMLQSPDMLLALEKIIREYSIERDPFIAFRLDRDPNHAATLQKMLQTRETRCLSSIKQLRAAAEDVYSQLGRWAGDHYLHTSIKRLVKAAKRVGNLLSDTRNQELIHLNNQLSPLLSISEAPLCSEHLSSKARALANFLVQEYCPEINGIIFVQRRSTAFVLAALLSAYRPVAKKYKLSPIVGSATHTSKSHDLVDIADTKLQHEALHHFRVGTKDLLVSTSVLEEGIDVSATNLIIRFDPPPNLRSYVQSRGRARKVASKFVMMLPVDVSASGVSKWDSMEENMKALYSRDLREIEKIVGADEVEEEGDRVFVVESTGARLNLDEAPRHLYHFCASLPRDRYADNVPHFIYESDNADAERIVAKVILPAAIDSSLRVTGSEQSWLTQKQAKKDCSFQAYIKLYKAGLINDNLLPIRALDEEDIVEIDSRESFATVQQRLDIWSEAAKLWGHSDIHRIDITICLGSETLELLTMFLPFFLDSTIHIQLYWNDLQPLKATVIPQPRDNAISYANDVSILVRLTHYLFNSLFSLHLPSPPTANSTEAPIVQHPYMISMSDHLAEYTNTRTVADIETVPDFTSSEVGSLHPDLLVRGLLRRIDRPFHARPYAFHSVLDQQLGNRFDERMKLPDIIKGDGQDDPGDISVTHLVVKSLPKRLDYLHDYDSKDAHTGVEILPETVFSYDPFPLPYANTMLFFPSICHRIELRLVAQRLQQTLLRKIEISDVGLIEAAISTPSAGEEVNYERLEYLGDTLLKVHTSFQMFAENPQWHEGRLSIAKTLIINNAHLSKAAIALGLDRYIHTDRFLQAKWKPAINTDLLRKDPTKTREISTKTLADVVEAIIGAAYMDGSDEQSREQKTLSSLNILLPQLTWNPLSDLVSGLKHGDHDPNSFPALIPLQNLLSYHFKYPTLLISALTHPSVLAITTRTSSFQQLEFLGDALLDLIIVETMIHHRPNNPLPQSQLTLIRHALANIHILSYFCLSSSYTTQTHNPVYDPVTKQTTLTPHLTHHYLWQFMRHNGSPDLITAQTHCQSRYTTLSPQIHQYIHHGATYPWIPLLQLKAEKFYSDIIESILGAIFIDSRGNLSACRAWLRTLGLLPYLERILDEEIDCVHPKMKLGILAGGRKVRYRFGDENASSSSSSSSSSPSTSSLSSSSSSSTPSQSHSSIQCTILIDNVEYWKISDAESKMEAQARAAEGAIEKLRKGGGGGGAAGEKGNEHMEIGGDEMVSD
ncbi:putative dicer-like protein 2 [Phaeomoniella chlamydospora]|uniref:Putative dicer-like protein 2 n=1 Tax=Phaeomoniella chlamydospora TaxID=158046 RepID=A0A0G2EG49_PHACM|nr:putative dicer-like protein 2 [Phaeomoniella chlamydospora]